MTEQNHIAVTQAILVGLCLCSSQSSSVAAVAVRHLSRPFSTCLTARPRTPPSWRNWTRRSRWTVLKT